MNNPLLTLKKKLLTFSSSFYVLIIVISTVFIPVSIVSLSNNIATDKFIKNSETSVAKFDNYYISHDVFDNSILDIKIFLENGDKIEIDSNDYSEELETSLASIENGENIYFILDPEDGYVIKLSSDTLIYQRSNGILSTSVAVILLILSLSFISISITFLVLRNIEKKKRDTLLNEKVTQFAQYSYKIAAISKESRWIMVQCNEEDAREDATIFVNLLKRIAVKLNNGHWEGKFIEVGEQRYRIENDPLCLTYQYDSLFGIVIEYTDATPMNKLLKLLIDVAEIQVNIKK